MAKYEHELSALDGLGLDDVQMDDALTHLLIFVQAWARAAAYDPEHAYQFGLQVVLDGLATQLPASDRL